MKRLWEMLGLLAIGGAKRYCEQQKSLVWKAKWGSRSRAQGHAGSWLSAAGAMELKCLSNLAMILLVSVSLATKWAGAQQTAPSMRLDLDQAIQLALAHNHALRATRTQIQQSQAAEITAGLRPNPVLNMDYNFVPIFSPSVFSVPELQRSLPQEFDAGIAYTIERGHKRQARVQAARDQTAVTQSQVLDSERALIFNVGQQFIGVLFAKSTLEFAEQDLASFQHTVGIGEYRYKAGDISKGDLLKIQLQLLQFQTDVSSAQLALIQALANLRQLLGYDAVPENYDVVGELTYTPFHMTKEDLEAMALKARPDFAAAKRGVTAAQSQNTLAKANGKRDLTVSFQFSHAAGVNAADFAGNIEIPIFTRNQGEIARTHFAIGQAEELRTEAQQAVITDVVDAYEGLRTNGKVVEFYQGSYLKQSEESLDISQFAYSRGAASLLDFLDAERSYRNIQLAYRQALSNYMLSLEQVREAVGKRNLP